MADKVKFKVHGGSKLDVIVTYIDSDINFDSLKQSVSQICCFEPNETFTMKWLDQESDACIMTSQDELDEMMLQCQSRLDSKQPEVVLHVFAGQPPMPGLPCPGEMSRHINTTKWWKEKTKYLIGGHVYQKMRLKRATCAFCHDSIWGLGNGGLKCSNCKLMVHKKCHKLCKILCNSNNNSIYNNTANKQADKLSKTNNGFVFDNPALTSSISIQNRSNNIKTNGNQIGNYDGFDSDDSEDDQYRLNDFELLGVVGRGSYAKVLMVELKKTKRIYAMKVIKKEMFVNSYDEDIDWVQTEKHVFETASNFPFLVGLHSCFQNKSRLFFVIDFVRGGDLMYHMQMRRRLQEHEARFYAAEISLALDYLHTRGIIYRDLKLDNVLLDHEGHIKLTDYGMCKEGMKKGEKTSTFCGTPNYISPELLRREEYDYSVDWWALGVLLYEMLAGKSPYDTAPNDGEDQLFQIILEKTIRIPRDLSVSAIKILKEFLRKNPTERLGCNPTKGFSEIKNHDFFACIDWEKLLRKEIDPPYKPILESERDLKNFDPHFTNESVAFTPDDNNVLSQIDQSEFYGFSYVNPALMSVQDEV